MGLPAGEYRFHVYGHHYVGSEATYPWTVEAYDITSDSFVVEPAQLTITPTDGNDGLLISLNAPEWGYRLIDIGGSASGANPPMGIEVTLSFDDGRIEVRDDTTLVEQQLYIAAIDVSTLTTVSAIDIFGNQGEWTP